MNKYEKQLIDLQEDYKEAYKEYAQTMHALKAEAQKACNIYNGHIGVINSERHSLREELRSLYEFLQELGNVGVPITVFDYVLEVPESIHIEADAESEIKQRNHGSRGIGDAVFFAISPAAYLAGNAVKGIFKRKKDKEHLLEQEIFCEEEKTKWENQIGDSRRLIKFYKTAAEIADLYRIIVATVRDVVKRTIIPELDGIYAFLSAFSIKESVIYEEDPDEAAPVKIEEFKGTPYEQHFVFVKNAFEYYQLIKAFFTEPILTKIVRDREISKKEETDFKKKIDAIKDQGLLLERSTSFGG